jgi:hypothetical protein
MAALLNVLAAEAAGFPETALMLRFRCKRSGLHAHPNRVGNALAGYRTFANPN